MLCYRFALRISHHIRQPWSRGRWEPGMQQPPGASSTLAPHVVRQLQRRQRQLLENSLELLQVTTGGRGDSRVRAFLVAPLFLPRWTQATVPGRSICPGDAGDRSARSSWTKHPFCDPGSELPLRRRPDRSRER